MAELPINTTTDDVHAHPRHVGHHWTDLILALTAVFISAVSLYVAVDHGRIERQLVQANSWPFLGQDAEYSIHSPTRISVVNSGIGPAKLESLQVLYRGQPMPDLYTLLEQCCGLPADKEARKIQFPQGLSISDPSNSVFRPGDSKRLIEIPASSPLQDVASRFLLQASSIAFSACYCSVFDQCWITDLAHLHPQEAASCPAGVTSFNQGTH